MRETERFINIRPIVVISVSACVATLGVVYDIILNAWAILLPFIAVLLLTCYFLLFGKSKGAKTLMICVSAVFVLFAFVTGLSANVIIKYQNINCEEQLSVRAKVENVHYYSQYGSYRYTLNSVCVNDKKVDCKIYLYSNTANVQKCDIIEFKTKLTPIELTDFAKYAPDNVGLLANCNNVEIVGNQRNLFETINYKICQTLTHSMGDEAGFAYALLCGDSSLCDQTQLTKMQLSGTAHIFAVSGLHIGFLAVIVGSVLSCFYIKRLKKAIIVFIVTFFYSGVCGFSPSSLRAVFMIGVYLLGRSFGQHYDLLNGIAISCLAVLLINPLDILSAGFVLSFGCVLSIALFSRAYAETFNLVPKKLNTAVSVGVSTQLGVLPVTCYYFGYVSVLSVIFNIVVLPLVAVLFPLLAVTTIIAMIFPNFLAVLTAPRVFIGVIRFFIDLVEFERLVAVLQLTVPIILLYYSALIFASDRVNTSKRVKVIATIVAVSLLLIFTM